VDNQPFFSKASTLQRYSRRRVTEQMCSFGRQSRRAWKCCGCTAVIAFVEAIEQ
jgi:hypothetical protein